MEVKVWNKNHKNINIIIRAIDSYWEYLFIWKDKIYSAYMVSPYPFRRFFWKEKYKDDEVKGCINLVYKMALTTIEELIKKDAPANSSNTEKKD